MYYEDNVKVKIDWKGLILKLIAVVLLILVFIWLFPMPKLDTFYSRVYNENLNSMKEVAEKYFTNDNLPAKTGSSNTIKLQEMIDKKLITEFTDKNNNECSATNSYAQVTKTENDNYVLKIQLSCDDKTDYVLETLNTTNTTGSSSSNNSSSKNSTSTTNNNSVDSDETASSKKKESKSNTTDEDDGIEIDRSSITGGDSKYDKGQTIEYEYKRAITKTTTTYTCPDGYAKDGNTCYKYDTGEVIPATALYFDDEVVTTEAKKNTTGGYTKYAEVIKTEISSENVCPEGYTLNGNICYKYVSATVVPGTTTYSCPEGYTLNGTSCVIKADRIENKGSDYYTCPEGYTLNGTMCTTSINQTESHDDGYYTCPSGYTLNGTLCTSTVNRISNTSRGYYTCPSGYYLNGTSCKYTINATRNTTSGSTNCTCPSGYSDNGSNCSKTTTYTGTYHAGTTTYGSCPSGWTTNNTQCIKAATANVSWTNPQYISSRTQLSEYNNGTTKRVRNGSPQCKATECTYNYIVYTAKTTYSCSQGSLSNSNCVMNRTASTTAAYYTCNNGNRQSSSTCYNTSYVSKNCTTTQGNTTYSCPSDFTKNGTSCVRTISATYHNGTVGYSCPDGYAMNGTVCNKTINATKHEGSTWNSCPDGYTMNGNKCYKTINATKHEGSIGYSCPVGYAMMGDSCERTIEATPHTTETEYTCPTGYVKKGTTCYQYTEPTAKKTYSYTCPEGFTAEGSGEQTKCSMYIESKTTYYCENAEEALVESSCVKKIKGALKGYECPPEYILNNDVCVKKTIDYTSPIPITNTSTTYEYKWSTESSIEGWTQTGKTRNISSESENLYEK